MPVLTTIRQSPAYLYAKTYCLCAIVTLFQAAPVSSRFPLTGDATGLGKQKSRDTCLQPNDAQQTSSVLEKSGSLSHKRKSLQIGLQSSIQSDRNNKFIQSRPERTVRRWYQKARDLANIKTLLLRDDKDLKTYPEIAWDATVRCSSSLHPSETAFISLRQHRISSRGINSLHSFLGLPQDELVHPEDIPLIALGGSGGGYRAMYGFTGFIAASKNLGLWNCLTWTAGVSGSCWTLAGYYTIASQDVCRLISHYLMVSNEITHPLSVAALDRIVRSSKGVYFLLGPLVRKVRSGIIGLGIMDLYATLTTAYQFLSREPRARLSRATFQWSRTWSRSGIEGGLEPMPMLTAVRRAPRNGVGVKPHADSSLSKGQPPSRALKQHQMTASHVLNSEKAEPRKDELKATDDSVPKRFFQWFEVSPLEAGCPDTQSFIPTWSWGRTFASGKSVGRPPEQSLSLILGQCTSAPAGPLTGYISALLASLPKGTIMSRLLLLINDFVRMKKWERLWGNPIRAGHDPNPFYGQSKGWEVEGRIRLMDSGMSNNLPNHILARPERGAEVIIAFDASSDVHTGSAIKRIHNFAEDCHLQLQDETHFFEPPSLRFVHDERAKQEVESSFIHQYARVFHGRRENGDDLYLIYCPLLPNGGNPGFNPSKASFSTSYNLVWTPEQIQILLRTSEANLTDYAIETMRQVVRKVYFAKKARRLALAAEPEKAHESVTLSETVESLNCSKSC